MHIPDGFLTLPALISTNIASAAILYPSIKKLNKELSMKRIPIMGISAAFVFTSQMLSFPIFGGTSVHISGAVLIAALLGPLSGMIITSSAIILQSLLFQHGGILTLGANIFNIAIVQSMLGYLIFKIFPAKKKIIAVAVAAFFTKIIASAFCAFELIVSNVIPLKSGLVGMLSSHSFVGIIEGVILASVFSVIIRLRPDLLEVKKI